MTKERAVVKERVVAKEKASPRPHSKLSFDNCPPL
jgi:hypothetical protein